ncbi:unnamed protein product, partial [Rhizoctonia solani]
MCAKSGGAMRPLRQYTEDSFQFAIPDQVYQFLNILCDTSARKSWSTEDAQLYLREFVEGNGIVRLTDAVRYPMNSPRSWSFQRGYVPIFVYLTSESVIKKGLHADINKLYGVIHNNFKTIRDTIETHMPRLIKARSFKDGHKPLSGRILFKAIFSAIHEYVTRFKVAASNPVILFKAIFSAIHEYMTRFKVAASNPDVRQLVERMAGWFDTWAAALSSNPPFDDECVRFETYQKESIIENIDNDKERLLSLVKEPVALGVDQGTRRQEITEGLIANLQRILDNEGPGHLCKEGPRHDNDHDKIRNISVAPTPDELLCDEDPYLPGNFFEAPHHLEPRSVQRLFDIQFRLLREEMMAPVRRAVQSVVSDLKKPNSISTTLSEIIRQGGGRYVTPDTQDSVMFSVFTNITFHPLSLDTRGISLGIEFDTPPGDGQSDIVETRVAYWDRIASKRLTQDSNVWSLALNPSSPSSIKQAKTSLLQGSRLDPSQVDAVVDSLTREVSLIQGPPGTGKSYTGLELIRVLVKSGVAPILMVAFTNHALDHMLKGILDNEITDQIIRLGSRFAADERLAGFSLEELESNAPKSKPGRPINSARRAMGEIEDEMDRLMKSITRGRVPGHEMEKYLASAYPGHYHELVRNTPAWISALFTEASGNGSGWNIAGRQFSGSMVDFWLDAKDLKFLEPPAVYAGDISQQPLSTFNRFRYLGEGDNQVQEEQDPVSKHQQVVYEHIQRHGLHVMPPIPTTNRLPRELQGDPKVWSMSFSERRRLYNVWYMPASQSIRERQLEEFEDLRRKHIWALEAFNKAKEEYRANLLREAHIVGCTTTGAAKLVSLLSEMRPKVLIVEEAGQVLESHILATLVGSVNHLIMIGDPLQLRPNINSWKLSSDNPVTGKIYRFNESLMERLARNGFPMTQLDVQRRMRPSISSLIRTTLYPNLQDNAKVFNYPDVRGMDKNVFFISHENLERGGGEDSVSKHNEFEINLIYDLVAHLL